jgi:succinoglycan biosynthesis protein ExoA
MEPPSLPEGRQGEEDVIDCSVLMPVLNEEHHIVASVAAMRRQRFDGQLEFIIADGGSDDRTRELLRELAQQDPRIRLVDNPRRIAASGLNVALRHARGKWVARMDAHTEYRDDYVALGVARLLEGGTRWVSGPPIAVGRGPVSRAVSLALRSPVGRGGSRKWAVEESSRDGEYELDSGVFAGVWERTTLLEYGGWDERWRCNQDSEMAGRFLARGERLICLPAMAARYAPRDSFTGLWGQYLRYGEYRERTAVTHPGTMRRSHLLAPAVVLAIPIALLGPRRLRTLARRMLQLYGATLVGAGAFSARHAEHPGNAALVPPVLAVMHLAHGTGALVGVWRYGPPLVALGRTFRPGGVSRRLERPEGRVCAPSLTDSSASIPEPQDLGKRQRKDPQIESQ